MRYLGVDPGKKRVGLAVCDPTESLASPLQVLQRRALEQIVADIAAVCRREQVGAVVVGLPLNMDGSKGPAAQDAEHLAQKIAEAAGLPVHLWDERLSSVTVEQRLIELDMSRAKRRGKIDKLAAQVILQGFLDARHHAAPSDDQQ